ncbi:MAG TPA: hypothetical protein VD907_04350 [Verrucomicrobiae bacterium]|nr:hypothetical protein [Verrucomicrobiae bacterium]
MFNLDLKIYGAKSDGSNQIVFNYSEAGAAAARELSALLSRHNMNHSDVPSYVPLQGLAADRMAKLGLRMDVTILNEREHMLVSKWLSDHSDVVKGVD